MQFSRSSGNNQRRDDIWNVASDASTKMVDDLTAWPCRRVDSQAASAHCPILEGPGQAELAGSAPSEPPIPANLAKSSTLPRLDGPMRRNQSNVSIVVRASISSPSKPFSRACELTNTHVWRPVKHVLRYYTIVIYSPLINIFGLRGPQPRLGGIQSEEHTY